MSVKFFSKSSIKTGIKSADFWDGTTVIQTGAFESIATVSVGAGGSSTISFNSIPSTYKHLQIRAIARDTNSNSQINSLYISFNGVGGTSYAWHRMEGFGTGTPTRGGVGSTGNIWIGPAATNGYSSNIFAGHIIDIVDYANTNKYKVVKHIGGFDTNGTGSEPGEIAMTTGLFMDTTAISSISISVGGQSQVQYSRFALYGIKG